MAIDCARCVLNQGLAFIDELDDDLYSRTQPSMGAIGGHIRHIVDHFNALIGAIARRCDHPVPEGFGKAPSTLNYEDAARA